MKVLINCCQGGWSISQEAMKALHEPDSCCTHRRTDPELIALFEKKGSQWMSGTFSVLGIVDIPDDIEWYVEDYDGLETIHEMHRAWPESHPLLSPDVYKGPIA